MCIDIIKDLVDLDHYHFVIKIFPAVLRTITHSIKSYAFFSFNSNRLLYRLYRRINNRRNILTLEVKLNISVDWEICISSTRPTERRFLFFSIVPRSGRDRCPCDFLSPPFFFLPNFSTRKIRAISYTTRVIIDDDV